MIEDTAHRLGKSVDVIPSMPENAFGLAHDAFKAKIKEACNRILDSVDVILLAQASMTSVAAELQKELHIPVFCSIPYAARRVHEMLHV